MPPRQTRPPSVESLLPPILNLLQPPTPNPYSAHQKALTTTARLSSSGHHAIAVQILFETSRELLKLGEAGSGVELAVKMLEQLTAGDAEVNDTTRGSVTQLLALTPSAGPWRKKLADAAVRWSAAGGCPTGDPTLHHYLAETYHKERQFVAAEAHCLASGKRDSANLLADLMFEWSGKGKDDPAAYALRGTLPFLAQRPPNVLPALTFLTRFLSLLSGPSSQRKEIFESTLPSQTSFSMNDIQLTSSPTLNFLQLALVTIQRAPAVGVSGVQARGMDGGIAREWQSLVNRYTRASGPNGLLGKGEVQEVLAQISTEVFLIPQKTGQNDLLSSLMGSFFGGGGGSGGAGRGAIGAR